MNCEQCKEEIFALIERESVDPAGVREVLERCPDCRILFDEMKAALLVAERLPLDEPSPQIDAEILRAAARRPATLERRRKPRLQAPPWAMAAIALLAVGVGVWSIPRDDDFATEDALGAKRAESKGDLAVLPDSANEAPELEEAALEDSDPRRVDEGALRTVAASPAKPSPAQRERARAKRPQSPLVAQRDPKAQARRAERYRASEATLGLDTAEAPAAADASAAGAASTAKSTAESLDQASDQDLDDAIEACRKVIAQHERRREDDEEYRPNPERQLELGRCYTKLGDDEGARTWLERAASNPKTRKRAEAALKKLTPN